LAGKHSSELRATIESNADNTGVILTITEGMLIQETTVD